jgi:hypothetical protein
MIYFQAFISITLNAANFVIKKNKNSDNLRIRK